MTAIPKEEVKARLAAFEQGPWSSGVSKARKQLVPVDGAACSCQVFVTSLASAFNILSEDELGNSGLVHSYWLQEFFGYERDSEGYLVKNTEVWGRTDAYPSGQPHLLRTIGL